MIALLPALLFPAPLVPQAADGGERLPVEADYFEIVTVELPEEVVLEVSGLAVLEDGRPIAATRRGEVFVLENAYSADGSGVEAKLFVDGLQEPLGLLVHDGWIWFVQRGELSRMRDTDGDDRADEIETVTDAWRISGNYHEYNFGPRLGPDGKLWITTNKPFGGEPFGRQKWRGFSFRIDPVTGEAEPVASGLRSPAGVEVSPFGEPFYTDNQGEWCGASKLAHIEPGDFHGHPWGTFSCEDERYRFGHPGDPPNGVLMPRVARTMDAFKLPAVWFPYDKMGKSPAGMVWDTEGNFGPFAGQLFVSDQHHAWVMRVSLEEVNGHWQGACYPFRADFQCGCLRLAWGADGSLLVGQTNRGWGSRGNTTEGLERLVWTGKIPFEVREMSARADGFELTFTRPVDPATAVDPASYRMQSYTYLLHASYGSPEVDVATPVVSAVTVAEDGRSARLVVDGLRAGYVHELHMEGVRSAAGLPLLHDVAYYTLIEIPGRKEYMGREISGVMHWQGGPWLLRDKRESEEATQRFLEALELQPGHRVADVGAGNGYHTLQIAERVGENGKVFAVDIQKPFLRQLEERAKAAGLENVETIVGHVTTPYLEPDSCDLILMSDVYHELSHPELMLTNMREALTANGRLALLEFRAEDPEVPIKKLHKMTREQVVLELSANGFELVGEHEGLPWQHLLFFGRKE